jgi:hypothetical protein
MSPAYAAPAPQTLQQQIMTLWQRLDAQQAQLAASKKR